jgi:CreA protein
MKTITLIAALAAAGLAALVRAPHVSADEIGKVGVDWLGNDIVVEAVADPKVPGVTCYVSYFERGIIDRLQQGNWFEDPSNSSIDCRQTGPVDVSAIDLEDDSGEEIFKSRRSLIWKKLVVNRLYDKENHTLVYLAHSRQVQQGSAKMSISAVPLNARSAPAAQPTQ